MNYTNKMGKFFSSPKFYSIFLLISTLVASLSVQAQLVQIVVEPYDPSILAPDWADIAEAEGYMTYRIYAELQNPTDKVVEMTSQQNYDQETQTLTNCLVTFFDAENGWFNEVDLAATLGSSVNQGACVFFPGLCADSWLTIGMSNSGQAGDVQSVGLPLAASFGAVNPGVNFLGVDGSVFALPTDPNTLPVGPNNRVLLAQLTTSGDFTYGINLNVWPEGEPSDGIIYTYDDCFIFANEGLLNYEQVIGIGLEGPPLAATAELVNDNECGGDSSAEVCVDVLLGSAPFNISVTAAGDPGFSVSETLQESGQWCVDGLGCFGGNGTYFFTVTDANGYTTTEEIEVFCPTSLELEIEITPVFCFGQADGEITIDVTGGTGTIEIVSDIPGFDGFTGSSPFSTTITNVPAGEFIVTVDDENECAVSQTVIMDEPELFEASFIVVDMTCAGQCDGAASFEASGGVPPYTLTVSDDNGNEQDPLALCSGTFTATVSDSNGCIVSQEIEVDEPPMIEYNFETTNVTCNGQQNGTICISDVIGGTGSISWQISSPPNSSTPYGTEPCFTNLGPASYSVNFIDENGCIVTENNIVISEPEPLEIVLNATDISCNGFGDGQIEVSFTGGTGDVSMIEPEIGLLPTTLGGLEAAVYTIVIEDETGCQASGSATINEPEVLTVEVLSVTEISCGGECSGIAELLIEGGTGEITIFLNGEPSEPTGLCAGDYLLEVQDENGCVAVDEFTIIQPDPISFLISVNNVTCTGMNDGTVNILPQGGVGQVTFEIIEDVDPNSLFEGTYNIIGQDETGCFADTTFTIGADLVTDMELTTFSSPVSCWEEGDGTATVAVTGGEQPISYSWSDSNGQTTATAIGLTEDTYSVIVVDAIGCTLSEFVEVEPTEGCFFIATAVTPNGDGFNDEWVIGGLEYFPNSMVQVYNRWGQLLFESRGYSTRWDATWNGRRVPIADYYFVITYDENREPITGTVTVKY